MSEVKLQRVYTEEKVKNSQIQILRRSRNGKLNKFNTLMGKSRYSTAKILKENKKEELYEKKTKIFEDLRNENLIRKTIEIPQYVITILFHISYSQNI